MEETISLQDIFNTLKRRLKLLFIIPLIALVLSGVISYFLLTPTYESTAQILISQENSEQVISQQDVRTNLELINTYNEVMRSAAILDLVIDELNLDTTVNSLKNSLSISSENNSQVMNLTVEHVDPAIAVNIANTTATIFEEQIVNLMNIDNVNILAPATLGENPSPVSPNPTLNMAIALVIGLMLAVGLAFLLEYLDPTIKSEEELEKLLELPLLGVVPNMDEEMKLDNRKPS
ncbi:YveK family protein [Alkalihalobacillus trypoxylicola]|uniref:Capsular biosynthesis protein n=1 Tax=Alkalihalobacillus trypoxylicola TaxID=519424 RepID=A0A162DQX7_9BACI|nr:Wzz/FepE/Etk N-terminal domain-containing protein [Alkalihalobacillus trypoxylicola]KYG30602.1 capsular biosynthesis protein [Alkalihalobacillus trypoxylicola]